VSILRNRRFAAAATEPCFINNPLYYTEAIEIRPIDRYITYAPQAVAFLPANVISVYSPPLSQPFLQDYRTFTAITRGNTTFFIVDRQGLESNGGGGVRN
jgi:hypothetical protein